MYYPIAAPPRERWPLVAAAVVVFVVAVVV
jgi:hypothetical protein